MGGAMTPAPKRTRGRRRCAHGFTLLELLVAAAITAVLAGLLVAIVANVSGFWTRSSGRLSVEAEARFLLDQLALDLQSAVRTSDGRTWLAADVLDDTRNSGVWDAVPGRAGKPAEASGTGLRYDAPEIAEATFGQAGVWLRFCTSRQRASAPADTLPAPVAVGWQIVRRAGTPGAGASAARYFLHRAEVAAPRTLEAGLDILAPAYGAGGEDPAAGEPGVIRTPPVEAIVGENVIDFGVRFHARERAGGWVGVFPAAAERSYRAASQACPEAADLHVRILTAEGARAIARFEANPAGAAGDAEQWWALALAHSRVFTRRISLVAGPP